MLLSLTESDYATILSLYKSTKDKRIANYLNIIILKHKGYRQVEIADILNLDKIPSVLGLVNLNEVKMLKNI